MLLAKKERDGTRECLPLLATKTTTTTTTTSQAEDQQQTYELNEKVRNDVALRSVRKAEGGGGGGCQMFRALFFTTLLVTLLVNLIFLVATKDKPPDLSNGDAGGDTPTGYESVIANGARYESSMPVSPWSSRSTSRRLFLRSNDFYDYSSLAASSSSRRDGGIDGNKDHDDDDDDEDKQQTDFNTNESSQSSSSEGSRGDTAGAAAAVDSSASDTHALRDALEIQARQIGPRKQTLKYAAALIEQQQQTAGNDNDKRRPLLAASEMLFVADKSNEIVQPLPRGRTDNIRRRLIDRHKGGEEISIDNNETTNKRRRERDGGKLLPDKLLEETSHHDSTQHAFRGNEQANKLNINKDKNLDAAENKTKDDVDEHHDRRQQQSTEIRKVLNVVEATASVSQRIEDGKENNGPQQQTSTASLNIRVKSSKNHVLVRVDNLIIYESGAPVSGPNENGDDDEANSLARLNGEKTSNQEGGRQNDKIKMLASSASSGGGGSSSSSLFQRRHVRSNKQRQSYNETTTANVADNEPRRPELSSTYKNANLLARLQTKPTTTTTTNSALSEQVKRDQVQIESSDTMRGIHVVVLNQFDGRVMAKRLFDTYSPQQDDELVLFLRQIQDGRLIVMAVQDEASFKMARHSQARKFIQRALGSRRILDLAWRDMWALVAFKQKVDVMSEASGGGGGGGGGEGKQVAVALAEGLRKSARFDEWARPVKLRVNVKLEDVKHERACSFSGDSSETRARRREFCSHVEGYGRVCDCEYPTQLDWPNRVHASSGFTGNVQQDNNHLWDVPIVVIASNRPYYLYRMLRSLLAADGVDRNMISVFIDGFYDEPKWLCRLLNVRYIQQAPRGLRGARISHHYKQSLTFTFERLFPLAKLAIILEEDLDVARDAFTFFNHTRALLERDPTLYCVSAWNDQGYEHSVGSESQLMRIETMPGLGWMLTRRLFDLELKPAWPPESHAHDWDMWIRTANVRKGRECIIPDISRTYHFGSRGTNINLYFQRQYFQRHAFSGHKQINEQQTRLDDVRTLERDAYEQLIESKLNLSSSSSSMLTFFTEDANSVRQIDSSYAENSYNNRAKFVSLSADELCSYNLYDTESYTASNVNTPPPHQVGQINPNSTTTTTTARLVKPRNPSSSYISNVIFIKMIDSEDFQNWLHLAKCWHLWDLDARGQHKAMWRLYLNGRQTFVIGYPSSPYSKFMPPRVRPYNFATTPAHSTVAIAAAAAAVASGA